MEFKHLEKIAGLLEEEIPLPEGAKAIHPEVEAREIEEKVKKMLGRYRNTDAYDSEVFESTNKLIPQTKKGLERIYEVIKIKWKEIESEVNAKYRYSIKKISRHIVGQVRKNKMIFIVNLGRKKSESYEGVIKKNLAKLPKFSPKISELWSPQNSKVEQEDFEIGKSILNYFPYGVDFSKEEIQIRNLYTGKRESGRKFFPEMDGFTSVSPSTSLQSTSSRLWFYKTQQLGKDNLKKKDKTMVRDILGKIGVEEELWFYPVYEIPIISKRKAKSRQKVLYKDSNDLSKFKIDILEFKVHFESSGAFFFDAVTGEEMDRLIVDSYFKREEKSSKDIDYSIDVIKTEKLNWRSFGSPRTPQFIAQINFDYNVLIIFGVIIGIIIGTILGGLMGGIAGAIIMGLFLGTLGVLIGILAGPIIRSLEPYQNFEGLFRYFENYTVW
jgi:hypothetical protein